MIGHEITHGFDDKGKQFDEQGNINQWWDEKSSTSFRDKAQCIISEYKETINHTVATILKCGQKMVLQLKLYIFIFNSIFNRNTPLHSLKRIVNKQ